jgi:UDP-3-O-[3-hydroxymyristoyl] glucosamine N-acyltransferase
VQEAGTRRDHETVHSIGLDRVHCIRMQALTTSQLLEEFKPSGLLADRIGPDVPVQAVAPADACGPGDLVFADTVAYLEPILESRPAAVVTHPSLADKLPGFAVLTAPNVRLAQAHILQRHFDRDLRAEGWGQVHASAVVHPSAEVAGSACIGPNAVIGARARIGERCVILSGAVIERDAVIGADTVVHPNAVIGWGCEIGERCIVKAGAVIGSEGFGFAQDRARHSHRIPQLGKVVVEREVVVGAACCIDRAAFRETRIGAGTILDNLCHIAHNVRIGEDCILTAMLCVAGSTTLGKRVITSGMTGILDHVTICDDVVLVQRAGVANDIKQPGTYAGSPIQPIKDYMKTQAQVRRLDDLRMQVKEIKARLAALEADPQA